MGQSNSRGYSYPLPQPGYAPFDPYRPRPTRWLFSRKDKEPAMQSAPHDYRYHGPFDQYPGMPPTYGQLTGQPQEGTYYSATGPYAQQVYGYQPRIRIPEAEDQGLPPDPVIPQPQQQIPRSQPQMQPQSDSSSSVVPPVMPEPAAGGGPASSFGVAPPPVMPNAIPPGVTPRRTPMNIYAPPPPPLGPMGPPLVDPVAPPVPPPSRAPNPLPEPPRDVWQERTPYRKLLRDLPESTRFLEEYRKAPEPQVRPEPEVRRTGTGLFSYRRKSKKRGGLGGLFRSASENSTPHGRVATFVVQPQVGGGVASVRRTSTSSKSTPVVVPPVVPAPVPAPAPQPGPPQPANNAPQSAAAGGPIHFGQDSPYAGFLNHSPHRVMHENKLYPSAMHLLEAMRFLPHRPDLAEKIRTTAGVEGVYPLSVSMNEYTRDDWGEVLVKKLEEVLWLKFRQHPDLRALLLSTGVADLVYAETNDNFWGHGPLGEGLNHLGQALVRVRERLKAEGY